MRARFALVLTALAALVLAASGCGEDSEVTAAPPPGPPGFEGEAPDPEAFEEFQACLEAEGVDPPDPGSGPPEDLQRPSERDAEALQKCAGELPGGMPGGPPGFGPPPGES